MPPPNRPEGQLNLNLSSLSPIAEPGTGATTKSPFGNPKSANSNLVSANGLRGGGGGAGSPSHEQTSRLFPKRTRELATPVGVSSNIWGPPTSGTSTPLFEIPESPDHDGFPDLIPLADTNINSPARRARAGTLPSRISPVGTANGPLSLTSKTSRPTPSTSPFRPSSASASASENAFNSAPLNNAASSNSTLLSRLRAGSMPQKGNLLPASASSSFGQSSFATSPWNKRNRAVTLSSIQSADETTSPQQSGHKDGLPDAGVRTLDYLGLAESSYTSDSDLLRPGDNDGLQQRTPTSAFLNNLSSRTSNRFRSFSVNTQPKNSAGGYDNNAGAYPLTASGTMTPSAQAALEAEYEAVQERVRLHNQAVQAFALNATAARPRARTAGLVETPQRAILRKYGQIGGIDVDETNADQSMLHMVSNPNGLADAFYDLNMGDAGQALDSQDDVGSQISRSLWIGSIPNSTTVSSLDAIFANYGAIESTRVLTHKNCGFVNYENVNDAIRARQILNGKEIFPGAGPVRIGFAKAPNSTAVGQNANANSPLLDQYGLHTGGANLNEAGSDPDLPINHSIADENLLGSRFAQALADLKPQIVQIAADFGVQQSDLPLVSSSIDNAHSYDRLLHEIPTVPEPSPNRLYDAPRLRDIRKRIDNGTCSVEEIEHIAIDMLPEIAELSSDYLGNTVVQKLFEYCSESVKDQMLDQIAPHLAEIGVHKNGTWAAQKIIEVCRTDNQIRTIIDHLHPYTVPLFLDQYGNYVLQCCLKYGQPYNDFIFETMISQLWEIAQGRFGARAMRACLESHHATKNQQRLIAAIIALQGVKLATNTNGALLLTWILDTCTFPKRRSVLAPRLLPHLTQLCTHKVAYLTVLKLVNQRNEPDARELIINELFFTGNDNTLAQILRDQASGVSLIFKILTNPFLDDKIRPDVMQKIATTLEAIKAQPNQGYKRLMDEVGLSSRPLQPFGNHVPSQGKPVQNINLMQYGGYGGATAVQPYENGSTIGRTASSESFGYSNYGMNGYQPQPGGYANMPFQQISQLGQYGNFPHQIRNNTAYHNNSLGGYTPPPLTVEALRNLQNTGSPLNYPAQMSPLMNAATFNSQGYSQPASNMYNYNGAATPSSGYYFNPSMQTIQANGRGRRVC